jgi:hypothetical protein
MERECARAARARARSAQKKKLSLFARSAR